jgi:hypothetical protein
MCFRMATTADSCGFSLGHGISLASQERQLHGVDYFKRLSFYLWMQFEVLKCGEVRSKIC